jgi:phosphonate transport system substrate-binding protein
MSLNSTTPRQITRRQVLRAGAGLIGLGLAAACAAPLAVAHAAELRPAAPAFNGPAFQGDTNAMGWPTAIPTLALGLIPLEDTVQQKSSWQPFIDYLSQRLGVPVEFSVTTSYAALVEAQRGLNVTVGYYGPLSFLLAEQQFGAVPLVIDSRDGVNPGSYTALLLAGKDSPVKSVQEIRGQDFTLVDPASTSGNLFPRVMLLEEGIDPGKDIKARYAGNHQNSILAIANGQVPCGASNNLSVDGAISKGVIAADQLVVLKESAPIPNGPFATHPDLDPRAVALLRDTMTSFDDLATLKKMEFVGKMVPADTAIYDFVRRAAKTINLEFDEKGNAKPIA